jgi:N-acetylglucosaminyl-diphospho-decaprenol L-rhamnosyltransferase
VSSYVVDNASSDASVEAVAANYPEVIVVASDVNLGFARANNFGATRARGRYLLLLNPDTILHAGAIDRLVRYLEQRPAVAAVGPRLVNSDGTLQRSIERLPTLFTEWWRLWHLNRFYPVSDYPQSVHVATVPQQVEVLNGACLLLRREAVSPTGLFDEAYFVYSEEIDLCDRLRKGGWERHWLPDAIVTHSGGQSTRQVADQMFLELYRNKVKFFRKRRGPLSASLYKLILLQAALARCCLGLAAQILPPSKRQVWTDAFRQYRRLLSVLPTH